MRRPLDRFRVIETGDLDQVRATLARIYVQPTLQRVNCGPGFRTIFNHCQLTNIAVGYACYGVSLYSQFPETGFVTQIFPIAGRAEAQVGGDSLTIDQARSVTISASAGMNLTTNASYERLGIQFNPKALAGTLAALTGEPAETPLQFVNGDAVEPAAAKTLRDHLLFLVDRISIASAPLPKFVLAEFEQLLMVLFLRANRHNYSARLGSVAAVASWQVRRAEDYLEAHWHEALALADIANAVGVSALSLARSFRAKHGDTPMGYLRRLRLKRARALLQDPAAAPLAQIAAECGFLDLHRFADDYARAYGERPAQTRDRARDAVSTHP